MRFFPPSQVAADRRCAQKNDKIFFHHSLSIAKSQNYEILKPEIERTLNSVTVVVQTLFGYERRFIV